VAAFLFILGRIARDEGHDEVDRGCEELCEHGGFPAVGLLAPEPDHTGAGAFFRWALSR
jgi:hypothetical protein